MHQAQWSPERPLPPPVSLASQSHHEKPPEVTRNHAAQLAIVMQMSRQESRSSACPDHVTLQALITWLIKSRSRDCACTDDVADQALITWLIVHGSRVYQAMISD